MLVAKVAKKKRAVIIIEIPEDFMQGKLIGEKVLIRFEGMITEMFPVMDTKMYRQHIIIENGKAVFFFELCRHPIAGCMPR